jgi:DNA-binding NarL/FixJ family response regulator
MLTEREVNVVLMDIQMPDMDGLQATQYIKEHFPHIQVLVLSMIEQERYIAEAMEAGALGYVLKTTDRDELIYAIQVVARGERYISTEIAMKLLKSVSSSPDAQGHKLSAANEDPSKIILSGKWMCYNQLPRDIQIKKLLTNYLTASVPMSHTGRVCWRKQDVKKQLP